MTKKAAWLDSLLLVAGAALLIRPLFRLEYLDNWPSIESTFIADARMLADRLPHPGWQPLWYCGTRFDYVYPPALRYGTALLSRFGGVSPARAYHLFTAVFYVLGIVAVYWMVRVGSRSRVGALFAAAATALLSPSFVFLRQIRHDSAYWVPQRLHVLMAWGEGPHISALCVLPAALALSFLALRKWNPLAFAGAAALCALTVSINFYGAVSLAILFPIAAWSVWVGRPERSVWFRAAGIAVLAYALCAFWLTPSYVRITVTNLAWVSQPGNTTSRVILVIVMLAFGVVSRLWGHRITERAWAIFVVGAGLVFSLLVLGFFLAGLRVVGEPVRLIPELDLALILVLFEIIRSVWKHPRLHVVVALLCVAGLYPALRYVRHAYYPFPKARAVENQYEYVIGKWVHDHWPGERVLPSGTVRFWFNAWFDNPQTDGGSAQGMLNQILPMASYQITAGDRGEIAVLWLQALGTDAVIVPDRTSPEWYHDYVKPEKFRGLGPVLYDDRRGTVIYRIPRVHSGIGRVVESAKIAAVGAVRGGDDVQTLQQYVSAVEDPAQALTEVRWKSFDEFVVQAQAGREQSLLLQETYDPAWHAYEDGKPLTIRRERVMGFMLIDVPEGAHRVQLRFETPLENRIGQAVFFLGMLGIFVLVVAGLKQKLQSELDAPGITG